MIANRPRLTNSRLGLPLMASSRPATDTVAPPTTSIMLTAETGSTTCWGRVDPRLCAGSHCASREQRAQPRDTVAADAQSWKYTSAAPIRTATTALSVCGWWA